MSAIKRTSLNLDFELVEQAKDLLGTSGTTETIHRALEEVVRRDRLEQLLAVRFDHLPDGWLDELRTTGPVMCAPVPGE